MKPLFVIFFILFFSGELVAQKCTTLGQNPETAFPVCGSTVFKQTVVPVCVNQKIPVPECGNDGANYQDINPYWYKFTCYEGGTLDFLIKPNDLGDDYDWQLFDVTGQDPQDIYTNANLIVAGNWAGTYGLTGASPSGVNFTQCASSPPDGRPTFAKSPTLIEGHHYLLLVSHYSGSDQSGYELSFNGGSAIITDTTKPRLQDAKASCDGSRITIGMTKKMKCNSMASDGSDFIITSGTAKVIAATSTDCENGFDLDSLTLTLDQFLPPGDYKIRIQNGTDGNTLLDNCGTGIPEGDELSFTVEPMEPTSLDTIPVLGCAPGKVQVVFAGPMRCKSIAADGSDFNIAGPFPVTITGAKGVNCQNGLSDTVELNLSQPIVTGGTYTLSLKRGSDGNSILNECARATPVQSSLTFTTRDTVSAAFTYQVDYSCNGVDIALQNKGGNGINQWKWMLGNGETDTLSGATYRDTTFRDQEIWLTVSNGVCSDSAMRKVPLNQDFYVSAAFEMPEFVCPNDEAIFIDHSEGNIVFRQWNFGNGKTSTLTVPPRQQYPVVTRTEEVPVKLVVENAIGCKDTMIRQLKVINNCFIAVPTAFTPNGDGMNDYLYPLNAYKAENLEFRVYNRYGQKVFETRDWTQKWDGTFNGKKQPMGSYVWMLTYTNSDTGEKVFKKGATLLVR